jgi:hypothetical protein
MNCSKAQRHIPDLWFRDLDFRLRSDIESHLQVCGLCREWYIIWQNLRFLGQEQVQLPQTLNWKPFTCALESEMHNFVRPNRSLSISPRIPSRIREIIRLEAQ